MFELGRDKDAMDRHRTHSDWTRDGDVKIEDGDEGAALSLQALSVNNNNNINTKSSWQFSQE